MAFIWITIIGIHRLTIDAYPEFLYPDEAWTSCIFEHYDGISDESWEGPCGESAHERISFGIVFLTVLCEYGNGIFLSSIYLFGTPALTRKLKRYIMLLLYEDSEIDDDGKNSSGGNDDEERQPGEDDDLSSDSFTLIPGWKFFRRLFRLSQYSGVLPSHLKRSGGSVPSPMNAVANAGVVGVGANRSSGGGGSSSGGADILIGGPAGSRSVANRNKNPIPGNSGAPNSHTAGNVLNNDIRYFTVFGA
jgi:hypothetical protein